MSEFKYEMGDTVYVIFQLTGVICKTCHQQIPGGKWHVETNIINHRSMNQNNGHQDLFRYNGLIGEEVFSTEEKAQKECDRKNNKGCGDE